MEQYNTQFKEYIFVIFFGVEIAPWFFLYVCIYLVFRFSLLNVCTYYLIKLFVDNARIHKHPNYVCIYIICIYYICMFLYIYICILNVYILYMNLYITNISMYISMISVNLTSQFSIVFFYLFFNFCPLKCCFSLILSQSCGFFFNF